MAADVKQMMAELKELRRKSNDEKYPVDVREQFDMDANKLEMKILKENKVPGFSYGGAAKKKKMMGGGYTGKKMAMAQGGYANCGASVKPNGPRKG